MSAAPDTEFTIPEGTVVLDKYRVATVLGVGGMGLVVKAIHTALNTPVAIKFLLPQYTVSAEAGRRFIREAQAASKISSEHIVRVFDAGSSIPYGPYIVMEFLHGDDLAKHLRHRGPFSLENAIDYTVQAAHALAEAHACGIVHRDIKPANLFLLEQPDGSAHIKVLDFGISKVVEQTSLEVTKTTAILGSGLYMSPEQMKSSKTVDHRTDVYALGISLFELLTKTQPFTAESFAELAIKVNMEPPSDIREFRPEVSGELAKVISVAYAKKADERYQTVGEFAAALAPWASARTQARIEALARREMRRSIGSRPRVRHTSQPPPAGAITTRDEHPRSVPPSMMESQPRIPRPAPLPSASSLGMDTFGLSKQRKTGAESLTETAEQSFEADERRSKPGVGMLGLGVGLGVLLALGGVGFVFLRGSGSPASTAPDKTIPLPTGTASAKPVTTETSTASPNVEVVPGPSSATATGTAATADASAPTSAKVGPNATSPAKTSGPTATTATATATATATTTTTTPPATATLEPTSVPTYDPTATAAPCKIRNLDGTLVDCPK